MQEDNQKQAVNIIDELGLTNLSDEAKNKLVAKLAETLQNRIFVVLMSELSDDEKTELNAMVENGSDEQIGNYLNEKFPDLNDITREEYEKLRAEMLETKNDITELLNQRQSNEQNNQE
jgi:hypothetical protein